MPKIQDIANFFLSKEEMTNKKLQKLSYYAVAWNYALRDENLAEDTAFQAWRHGPVSPELYETYRDYGYKDIPKVEGFDSSAFSDGQLDILEDVYYTYGDQTGNALEALTHSELPWKISFQPDSENRCKNVISPEMMTTFYQSIYNDEPEC